MAGNRKAALESLTADIAELFDDPSNQNIEMYKNLFDSMSDEELETWMSQFEGNDVYRVAVIVPNQPQGKRLTPKNLLRVGEKWNVPIFERVIMKDGDAPAYLTPLPYPVLEFPLRRQAQLLVKKIAIPDANNAVDDLTGQRASSVKGAKISYPELQILLSHNLQATATEFMKVRGGDEKAFNAGNADISATGTMSLARLEALGTQAKVNVSLSTIFTCMHLSNTLQRGR